MRRLLIGIGVLFVVAAAAVVAVPFLLPKETIRAQVIEQIEQSSGWRLRLDGPVSLALIPGLTLIAENVGLSGEAGADGIEFAKARKVEIGLGWAGLLSGKAQVTGITLADPVILLETGPSGLTSWEPRRSLDNAGNPAPSSELSRVEAAGEQAIGTASRMLERIGIDRLTISNGKLIYSDLQTGERFELGGFDVSVSAPDLSKQLDVDGALVWNGQPVQFNGTIDDPIAFSEGKVSGVSLTLGAAEAQAFLRGSAGLEPLELDLEIGGDGPSVKSLAAVLGIEMPNDPGAFSLSSRVNGSQTAARLTGFAASIGSLVLTGAMDANLSGSEPSYAGRFVMKDGAFGDLLALAGQPYPASGQIGADLAVRTRGATPAMLVGNLDLRGSVDIRDGTIGGLDLDKLVKDEAANSLEDINLNVVLSGLSNPLDVSGSLAWRGETFTATGSATPGPFLAGLSTPVTARVRSNRVSFGFEGKGSRTAGLDGAMTVETGDLRNLLAWMGQPIATGSGLQRFKAAGLFTAEPNGIGFEETGFTLDETSGQADGRVTFGAKPALQANLQLSHLVLDPYLGKDTSASGAKGKDEGRNRTQSTQQPGWSTDAFDFSGLHAVNADLRVTAKEIRWDKIKTGESRLTAQIENGVLTANLEKLSLYEGEGSGTLVLNGASALPSVQARFSFDGLQALPALKDAAGVDWVEGQAAMILDVESSGASEQQLVSGLGGTARFEFADGAVLGLNIPKMVRELSLETLLGWKENKDQKTDFTSFGASFQIQNGVATTGDLVLAGPLVRMTGSGRTDMPAQTIDWKVEPLVVPTLQGEVPVPRRKGADKELIGLGVPVVIKGAWAKPAIYPDIAGILEDPEAAYKTLQERGGEVIEILRATPTQQLVEAADEIVEQVFSGSTQVNVEKVISGEADERQVLKAVEEGFGLPSGSLDVLFGRNIGKREPEAQPEEQ
ncbi:AsmA family protein [Roseibium sp. RKSG952]|uniref:AsmA family protein n=1 Tax=Roseibium sp. RKSG952 TaxID=2529384 RepID=UPI0012BB4A44|nr:AsmA family protein [Roseibium sp. RKSG952]MTH96905.1 AsmA family protein [Roseibium sp. RKSG952]